MADNPHRHPFNNLRKPVVRIAGQLPVHAGGSPEAPSAHGFSTGIPKEARTLVAIPSMLTNAPDIENLVEAWKCAFLANKDIKIFISACSPILQMHLKRILPGDAALVALAQQRIEELNEKYGSWKSDLFYLFHRPGNGMPVMVYGWGL